MAINWNNVSAIHPPFTTMPQNVRPAYGAVPQFVQTAGVLPGQAPQTGNTVAPDRMRNPKQFLNSIPSILNINVKGR